MCNSSNSGPDSFSEDLRRLVNEENWTYAKTMPKWPHEYLVRERVDEELFEKLVSHIRSNGVTTQPARFSSGYDAPTH